MTIQEIVKEALCRETNKALQGFASHPRWLDIPEDAARIACDWADAMLKEREKRRC